MKKCPTCNKTFEDSFRFCQTDGTPLVDDAPPLDPYATIVSSPAERAKTETPAKTAPAEEVAAEPVIHQTVGSVPISEPDDVLDLPVADPLKTVYVSEDEMKQALTAESPTPKQPNFAVPEVPAPSFGDAAPSIEEPLLVLDEPSPAPLPPLDEPETLVQPMASMPLETPPPAPIAEWTPPPAPDATWQNQEISSNTPFQPPVSGTSAGENKTLAIISLVVGILSLLCCGWFIPGIAAIILGFIAKGKATSDPAQYGGAGLALGGMITGGVSIILGIIVVILYLLGFAANLMR